MSTTITRRRIEGIEINGEDQQIPAGAVAYKHADPTEDARWIEDADEARKIEREDANLIVWVPIDITVADMVADVEVNAVATGTLLSLAIIRAGVICAPIQQDTETYPVSAEDAKRAAEELLADAVRGGEDA